MNRVLLPLLLALAGPLAAQSPGIQTTRTSAQVLPLPKSDDSFHFMIFGDRTGGPPEGLPVLRQAVTDTNLMDPDLVMTVGDLVNGYCGQAEWETMAGEYKGIMQGLKMPWFPTAGNHDVYWRGPGRPPGEHEASFEKHFGPLWYWFEHKKCAFIVLFSDEGDPSKGSKDFTSPAQQAMTPVQLAWLAETLQKTRSLKHAFVFLHHPKWVESSYPGAQWNKIHDLLKAAGNVRACFAGHIHRLRYDGIRDGVEYITLAATGGSIPGIFPQAGFLHHMNLVTVRPEGIKVATVPVGAVLDPRTHTPDLLADVDRVRAMPLEVRRAPIAIDARGRGAGLVEFKVTNPLQHGLDITVLPGEYPNEWLSTMDHLHFVLAPGASKEGSFSMIRIQDGFDAMHVPAVEFRVEMLRHDARILLPPRTITLPLTLRSMPPDFFANAENKAIRLDGKSAIRVEMGDRTLPDGPFTIEAWVNPASDNVNGDIISKAEQSEFALNLAGNQPGFHAFFEGSYLSAVADADLPAGQWAHVAGVFDGQHMRLFVNGKVAATTPATGKRRVNPLPCYLGANPDARSNPASLLTAVIDELRISKAARYTADFTPEKSYKDDAETVYLFHCDKLLGPFLPSDSAGGLYGSIYGKPEIVAP